jgi:hypothetical protein
MLYVLFLFVIAFRDEELAYPWTYAVVLGVVQAIAYKIFGGSWGMAQAVGVATCLYLGLTFSWLSRQMRFSLTWWAAFFLATLPVTGPYLLRALQARGKA